MILSASFCVCCIFPKLVSLAFVLMTPLYPRLSLPPAITRWLSCYLRGRQAATSFRGTKSSMRIVRTGVPQGSKLSPSLFNYYIADMSRPTPPVKRVCYADDITVWATGPNIPLLDTMINSYLREVNI